MRRAFTLAEVMVVIVILTIVAAVTAPSIARLGRETMPATTARAVLDLLHGARRVALERSETVTLTIDPASARWWATIADSGETRSLGEGKLRLDEGALILASSRRARWSFAPGGTATGDALVARERDGSSRTLAVDPWTGEPHADAR